MRVACAEFFAVVETTPRSVKIAVAPRAGVLERQDVAPQRDAGRLEPSTRSPWWANSRTRAQAAAVLPQFMQLPTMATTGMPLRSSTGASGSGSPPIRAGRPMRSPSTGKVEHRAEDLAVEGLPEVGIHRIADSQHAAEVEQMDDVARRQALGAAVPE